MSKRRQLKESEEDHLRVLKRIALKTIQNPTRHTYFVGGVLLAELNQRTYTFSFDDYRSREELMLLAQIYLSVKPPRSPYYMSSIKIITGEVDETEIRTARR